MWSTPGLRFCERDDLLMFTFSYWTVAFIYPVVLLAVLVLPPAQSSLLTLLLLYVPHLLAVSVMLRRSSKTGGFLSRPWDACAGFFLVESFIFVVWLQGLLKFLLRIRQAGRPPPRTSRSDRPGAAS
jgi:hypothetical protein